MCPFFMYALGVFSFDLDKGINMDYGSGMKFDFFEAVFLPQIGSLIFETIFYL